MEIKDLRHYGFIISTDTNPNLAVFKCEGGELDDDMQAFIGSKLPTLPDNYGVIIEAHQKDEKIIFESRMFVIDPVDKKWYDYGLNHSVKVELFNCVVHRDSIQRIKDYLIASIFSTCFASLAFHVDLIPK